MLSLCRFDIVNVNLKRKPAWYLELTKPGKVPLLQRSDGEVLGESLVTMEYIDEAFPGKQLFSKDPWVKAQDKVFLQEFETSVSWEFLLKMLFSCT